MLLCDRESVTRCLAAKREVDMVVVVLSDDPIEGCIPFSRLLEKDPLPLCKIIIDKEFYPSS